MIPDVRGKSCFICRRVWGEDPDDLANVTNLDTPASKEEWQKSRFVHDACYLGHLNLNERSLVQTAIRKARNVSGCRLRYSIEPIPNEYRGAYNTDWYLVGFPDSKPKAILKFGSRKRVWVVELTTKEKFDLQNPPWSLLPFLKDDVTMEIDEKCIMFHAWSEDKVHEYVAGMVRLIEEPEKKE